MKKLLCLIGCLTVCLSLAACTSDPAESTASKSESSTTSAATTETSSPATQTQTDETDATSTPVAGSMTVEEYAGTVKEMMGDMFSALESSGIKVDIHAKGNSLVYTFQYTIDVGDTSLLKDSLEQSITGMSSTFETTLSSMKLIIPEAESVIVEYLDKDGGTIVSKEFK